MFFQNRFSARKRERRQILAQRFNRAYPGHDYHVERGLAETNTILAVLLFVTTTGVLATFTWFHSSAAFTSTVVAVISLTSCWVAFGGYQSEHQSWDDRHALLDPLFLFTANALLLAAASLVLMCCPTPPQWVIVEMYLLAAGNWINWVAATMIRPYRWFISAE